MAAAPDDAQHADPAELVLDLVLDRSPGLGTTRLLCVDGPSGSGKSTLAGCVVAAAQVRGTATRLVHLDDLYEGWSGLGAVAARLAEEVVGPVGSGATGRYRRWDWHAGAWAEEHTVVATDLLVLEGVGAGTPLLDRWRSLLVWVTAPRELRRRRGLARDGDAFAPHWESWARAESSVHARDRTAERADLVVDGSRARPPGTRWPERPEV